MNIYPSVKLQQMRETSPGMGTWRRYGSDKGACKEPYGVATGSDDVREVNKTEIALLLKNYSISMERLYFFITSHTTAPVAYPACNILIKQTFNAKNYSGG
ncbi:MAG: hypothetical protein HQK83_19780 [Fibrobacteria bacterium]|nr:hypothetical protein [Fibrobacteria bacterium]